MPLFKQSLKGVVKQKTKTWEILITQMLYTDHKFLTSMT